MCEWGGPDITLGVVSALDDLRVLSELLFPVWRGPAALKLDSVYLL